MNSSTNSCVTSDSYESITTRISTIQPTTSAANKSKIQQNALPIIYSNKYSVKFCGLEKLHPFDSSKGFNIVKLLKESKFIDPENTVKPNEITKHDLLFVHSKKYLRSLKWSINVAKIAEIPLLIFVPNYFVQTGYLRPMRYQTAGTILAGKLALRDGWAINLGGGFHHCSADRGSGFCPYADITLLIQNSLTDPSNGVNNVMIVDLDAHQGNGHERDFMNNGQVYILDMYNARIFPRDIKAKEAIRKRIELLPFTEDDEYLRKLKVNLKKSLDEYRPDMIVYNAGTDVLEGDPLGLLSITPQGVIERDEIVFSVAVKENIPIVMLLSGGYLRSSAKVIADSILNLNCKGLFKIRR